MPAPHQATSLPAVDRAVSRLRLLLLPLVAVCAGCTIGTPITTTRLHDAVPADTEVHLSITHATVDPARSRAFTRQALAVHGAMDGQPGLVMFAIRRELFGDQVWTVSAWTSEADRRRFVDATAHRAAMAGSGPALRSLHVQRVVLRRDALPRRWDEVFELLAKAASIAPPA